jgi:multidrug resistance efflux pump
MIRKYVLPLVAILGIFLAVVSVRASGRKTPTTAPVADPPRAPFASYVAGAGLVEASTENIAIGTPVAGVVSRVLVKVGDAVTRGQPLMLVDSRDLEAQSLQKKAMLAQAKAQLDQLLAQPRAEDVPPAEARVATTEAELGDAETRLRLYESVDDKRAVMEEEMSRREFAVTSARAKLAEQRADLAKLKAGAWKPDVDAAKATVTAAESDVAAIAVEIDRRTIRSSIDGQALQVKIREGEFATAGALATPLMLLGNVNVMHVRVDVDENDAWRVVPGAKAKASIRGNGDLSTDLTYVSVEPYIIPKKSLTGDSSERVDTRVLQLIYAFPATALPAYVGQQMDVFIETTAGASSGSPRQQTTREVK